MDAEILRVGTDFMYVPLPSNIVYPIKVVMKFERHTLTLLFRCQRLPVLSMLDSLCCHQIWRQGLQFHSYRFA
jgi:hypothetical protein